MNAVPAPALPGWRGALAVSALVPVVVVAAACAVVPAAAWAQMTAIGLAMYVSAKALALLAARELPAPAMMFGYLAWWPGMDPAPFVHPSGAERPRAGQWLAAVVKIAIGIVLTWGVVRQLAPMSPLIAGWVGITGWVLLLHCGCFHLTALAWRSAGIAVEPIMRAPLLAASLGEFWGRRWNLAFHEVVRTWCYAPLAPLIGAPAASLATFVLSGVIHDLIISWPARAGYGLPTLYFLIQAGGVALERRLPRYWRRPLALLLVAAPAPLLFHPPFVERVMLPFLAATGALP